MNSTYLARLGVAITGLLLLAACGRPEPGSIVAPLQPTSQSAQQPLATATATIPLEYAALKPEYQTNIALGIPFELWDGWTPPPMSAEGATIEAEAALLEERERVYELTAAAMPTVVFPTRPADYVEPTEARPAIAPGPLVEYCNVERPEHSLRAINCWGWTLHGEEIVVIAGFKYRRGEIATLTPSTGVYGGVAIKRFMLNDSGAYSLTGDIYWTPHPTGSLTIIGIDGTQVMLRAFDGTHYLFDLESQTFTQDGSIPATTATP